MKKEEKAIRFQSFYKKRAEALEKIREAAISVLPIVVIVIVLCLSITPAPTGLLLSFLVGAVMIIVGMGLFTLGADMAMTPIGNRIGSTLAKSQKLWLILAVSFILGLAITVAEPDLQVLAETVPHIDNAVLLITVGVGVGLLLAVCMLRIIVGVRLRWMLLVLYAVVFALAIFADRNFLSVAFDSGGVTTGPMTVPFILALGVGISNARSDRNAEADSFGLVALCSVGPILAVLVLGFFYQSSTTNPVTVISEWTTTSEIGEAYWHAIPDHLAETAVSLAPIAVIFLIFRLTCLRMPRREFLKICLGILYTYIGLVLFLTGVNVGFSSLGTVLGKTLSEGWTRYLLIPLSMIFGWFIISAEPAVYVLEKQIEQISAGAIPAKAIKLSLSIAISLAMGISMLRVLTGISIMWFLVPGYVIALVLSFFVPDIYTAIAFDSGGVASGPMTATFMLQMMIGTSSALGGNVLADAFGVVAMVAMMPLISIQVMGYVYGRHTAKSAAELSDALDDEIIELWEVPS
mgnify:CR=1 FL=1